MRDGAGHVKLSGTEASTCPFEEVARRLTRRAGYVEESLLPERDPDLDAPEVFLDDVEALFAAD